MPKTVIDYSNTIIYKIVCKDPLVTDLYVGHTTNFVKRKYQHKISCNSGNNLKIYKTIRENGGWDNWDMVEVATYNCANATEARMKEQEHLNILNASLNVSKPFVDKDNYICKACNVVCSAPSHYEAHIKCSKHLKNIELGDDIKNAKYSCELCKFKCFQKCDLDKHILRKKHLKNQEVGKEHQLIPSENCKDKVFTCDKCNKIYNHRVGLWRHKKKCVSQCEYTEEQTDVTKLQQQPELIIALIQQNIAMQSTIMGFINQIKISGVVIPPLIKE